MVLINIIVFLCLVLLLHHVLYYLFEWYHDLPVIGGGKFYLLNPKETKWYKEKVEQYGSTSNSSSDVCLGQPQPDMVCTNLEAPVLGCDGEMYSNSCLARAAGVQRYESTNIG